MARVELPASRLKQRKRRRRVRVALVLCLLLAVLFAGAAGLAHIPALQVARISVTGTETLASSTLQKFVEDRIAGSYLWVFPKRNIFLYPKKAIVSAILRAYPVLASTDVHAGDFHTIAVTVVERTPRALWCEGAACYFIDENGVVYQEAPTFSAPIYISYSGEASGSALPRQYLTPAQFQALSALVDAVEEKLQGETADSVSVDANKDVRVHFLSGFELFFGLNDQAGDVFERISLALTAGPLVDHPLSAFEYLDLRFGDKLYYKLKSE